MKKTLLLISIVILLISCKKETVEYTGPALITVTPKLSIQRVSNYNGGPYTYHFYLNIKLSHQLKSSPSFSYYLYNHYYENHRYWPENVHYNTILKLPYNSTDTTYEFLGADAIPNQKIGMSYIKSFTEYDSQTGKKLPYKLEARY